MSPSVDSVLEILKKHKRVEGLVHGQSMPRQDIIETMVQRQHLAEVQNLMPQLKTDEIGSMLETLQLDDLNTAAFIRKMRPVEGTLG